MNYVSSITVDAVIDALKAFLLPFIPDGQNKIVRGQVNRAAQPADPCIVMTELLTVDLSRPRTDYQPPTDPIPAIGAATLHGPARIDVQLDFYGELSSDYCKAVKNAFCTMWAASQFPKNIQPLYASDGVQSPMVSGEAQWQSRWTLTVSLQYNPVTTVPQDFADELAVHETIAADVNYE
jgi:hypothetical protein